MHDGNNTRPLANRIKKARIAAGLSQSELARTLGIKPQAIQHWERGTSSPKTSRMGELAAALGIQVAWLLLEKPEINQINEAESITYEKLSVDEQILIKMYRRMDSTRRIIFNEIADSLARNSIS